MRMKKIVIGMAATICMIMITVTEVVQAAPVPIPGLFNTGVDDLGNELALGAVDPHYILASSPAGPGDANVINPTNQFVPPPVGSKWIGVSGIVDPAGSYGFTTSFDLTGLDHTTAQIDVTAAASNSGFVILNGAIVGCCTQSNPLGAFSIISGFLPGVNELRFTGSTGGNRASRCACLQHFRHS